MSKIREMSEVEVATLVDWAAEEGWNPGLNDAKQFWDLDPDGFLAIEIDGHMVGGGAIIRHNATFGFMGLFIVQKAYRGQQLGPQLWFARRDRLLARLAPDATIGLDAVDQMIPFYERGGFRAYTRHRRFKLSETNRVSPGRMNVVDARSCEFSQIMNIDRRCFPADRESFLNAWIHQPGAVALASTTSGRLNGYGVMRRCRIGWKIGPLLADSIQTADDLFRAFCQKASGLPIFIDVPDNNLSALSLCASHRLEEVFGCVRMYYGNPPSLDSSRIFAITTLEVG